MQQIIELNEVNLTPMTFIWEAVTVSYRRREILVGNVRQGIVSGTVRRTREYY
jgi:hypothetical protein